MTHSLPVRPPLPRVACARSPREQLPWPRLEVSALESDASRVGTFRHFFFRFLSFPPLRFGVVTPLPVYADSNHNVHTPPYIYALVRLLRATRTSDRGEEARLIFTARFAVGATRPNPPRSPSGGQRRIDMAAWGTSPPRSRPPRRALRLVLLASVLALGLPPSIAADATDVADTTLRHYAVHVGTWDGLWALEHRFLAVELGGGSHGMPAIAVDATAIGATATGVNPAPSALKPYSLIHLTTP